MNRIVRRKLTMAGRVLDFARANPSTDASWAGVVSRLEELQSRARELEQAERQGHSTRRTANATRRVLRERIQADMLRHLVTTAGEAYKDAPAMPKVYRLPPLNGPYRHYGAAARELLEAALPDRDLLVAAGLGERLLDDLATALGEFDGTTAEADAARRTHMQARADLAVLADEVTRQVRLLDGLMRPRIRSDARLRSTWERVSTLEGPETAGRTSVVGAIGPAPGNEMVLPSGPADEPSAEQEQEQGLLPPGSSAQEDNTLDGEGDRDVG